METIQKKAAVDLTDLALGIVVLGVVVTIGAVVLTNIRDNRLTELSTVETGNESVVLNSSIGSDTLANTWVKSVDVCYNYTDATVLSSSNYSVSISPLDGTATITNGSAAIYQNATCTYTWYNTSRADYALANNASNGIAEFGNWFKIIVIVGIAAVVLSLVFMAFGGRGSSATTAY